MVVAADGMDHLDGGDEGRDGVKHGDRVALVEGLAQLLQRVQVLEVVPRFV